MVHWRGGKERGGLNPAPQNDAHRRGPRGRTAARDEDPAAGEAAGVAALAEHERVRRRDIGPRPARCGGGSQGQAARGAEHVCPTLWSSDSNGLKRVRHAWFAIGGGVREVAEWYRYEEYRR